MFFFPVSLRTLHTRRKAATDWADRRRLLDHIFKVVAILLPLSIYNEN